MYALNKSFYLKGEKLKPTSSIVSQILELLPEPFAGRKNCDMESFSLFGDLLVGVGGSDEAETARLVTMKSPTMKLRHFINPSSYLGSMLHIVKPRQQPSSEKAAGYESGDLAIRALFIYPHPHFPRVYDAPVEECLPFSNQPNSKTKGSHSAPNSEKALLLRQKVLHQHPLSGGVLPEH